MKKIWIITLLAVATALSCAKINEQETVEPEEKPAAEKTEGRIVFNIQVNQAEGQTKAVKTGWETDLFLKSVIKNGLSHQNNGYKPCISASL